MSASNNVQKKSEESALQKFTSADLTVIGSARYRSSKDNIIIALIKQTGYGGFFFCGENHVQEMALPEGAKWSGFGESNRRFSAPVDNIWYEVDETHSLRRMASWRERELGPVTVFLLDKEKIVTSHDLLPMDLLVFYDDDRDRILRAYNTVSGKEEYFVVSEDTLREVPRRVGYKFQCRMNEGSSFFEGQNVVFLVSEGRLVRCWNGDTESEHRELEPARVVPLQMTLDSSGPDRFSAFFSKQTSFDLKADFLLVSNIGEERILKAHNKAIGRDGYYLLADGCLKERRPPANHSRFSVHELDIGTEIGFEENVVLQVTEYGLRTIYCKLPFIWERDPIPVYTLGNGVDDEDDETGEDLDDENEEEEGSERCESGLDDSENQKPCEEEEAAGGLPDDDGPWGTETYLREEEEEEAAEGIPDDDGPWGTETYLQEEEEEEEEEAAEGIPDDDGPWGTETYLQEEEEAAEGIPDDDGPWGTETYLQEEEEEEEAAEGIPDDDGPWGTETYSQEEEEVSDSSEVGSSDSDPESEDDEDEEEDVEEDEDSDSDESCETALEPSDGEDDISFDDVESCMTAVEPSDDDYSVVDSDSEDVDPEAAGVSSGEDAPSCTIC